MMERTSEGMTDLLSVRSPSGLETPIRGAPFTYDPPMAIVAHGVDIVRVDRIARMLEEHGERFLARCFTEQEAAYNASSRRRAEHLAVRFAAKEATFKALGVGWGADASWTEAEVVKRPSGEPALVVLGRLADLARRRGVRAWHLSLSHTDGLALASVVGDSDIFSRS